MNDEAFNPDGGVLPIAPSRCPFEEEGRSTSHQRAAAIGNAECLHVDDTAFLRTACIVAGCRSLIFRAMQYPTQRHVEKQVGFMQTKSYRFLPASLYMQSRSCPCSCSCSCPCMQLRPRKQQHKRQATAPLPNSFGRLRHFGQLAAFVFAFWYRGSVWQRNEPLKNRGGGPESPVK
jgi:hypothetical protein